MKKLTIVLFMAALMVVSACDLIFQDKGITLDNPEDMTIILKPEGESLHIGFTASSSWHAVVMEGMSWLEVSPAEGEGGSTYITVKALANETFETRTAVLNLMSEGERVYINFEQATNVTPVIEIVQNTFEVPAEGGVVDVHIKTNLEYRFDILDSWITEEKAKALVLPTNLHRLRVAPNNTTEERTGTVTVCANQQCIPITIHQAASEGGDSGQEGGGDTGNGQISSAEIEGDFVHRSLAVRFTATWCGYCPIMAETMEMAYEKLDGRLEIVSAHSNNSNLASVDLDSWFDRFAVSGLPSGVVDSRGLVENYESSYASSMVQSIVEETESSYPTKTGIAISSTVSGSDISVSVDVYVKEADTYMVNVLLLEDDIFAFQNGGGDNFEHDHVLRGVLTDVSGETVTIPENNSVWKKTYTGTLPIGSVASDMRVLVYVEKPYGERSKASGVSYVIYGDYGDTYVDNARSVALGTTAEVEYN